jgi:hypothetical protein
MATIRCQSKAARWRIACYLLLVVTIGGAAFVGWERLSRQAGAAPPAALRRTSNEVAARRDVTAALAAIEDQANRSQVASALAFLARCEAGPDVTKTAAATGSVARATSRTPRRGLSRH